MRGGALFSGWLFELRASGLPVGTSEWLVFLQAVEAGNISSPDELYQVGRAILCRSEADFDTFDVAFAKVFRDVFDVDPSLLTKLTSWLETHRPRPEGPPQPHDLKSREDLWRELFERLARQTEEHHGGNYWVGTGGRSPFGHSGRGADGIRIGGPGGGRQAVEVASERQWSNHRVDRTLDTRDFQVALRSVRRLLREGRYELDLDATIRATCEAGGDVSLVERRERENQIHLVLLLDTGGSMDPHAERVSQLFTAAAQMKTFKTFATWQFHNAPYGWLYKDYQRLDRSPTSKILDGLTPRHRLIFVGDASMAPYELFSASGWPTGHEQMAGVDWIRRFRQRCPASVWLNPEPQRYWAHPTVSAIGQILPMFELTIDGLSRAVKKLRAPV